MIVPFGAGGSSDAIARIVAESMGRTLGQSIVIENDGGAGGTTATLRAARAEPDGYTIIFGNMGTHGAAPGQYPGLRYDPVADFTPIGLSAGVPILIITRKTFPAASLGEFVAYLKAHPGAVNEGHAGVGSQTHAVCTLLMSTIGVTTARVAYRSTGQVINDLIGGQVDFGCAAVTGATAQVQGGLVRALAIASPARSAVLPQVPTTIEAGLPEFQVSAWNAVFAPRKLPAAIEARLHAALASALDDAATRARLLDIGGEIPEGPQRTAEALRAHVEREVARWTRLLKPQPAGHQ